MVRPIKNIKRECICCGNNIKFIMAGQKYCTSCAIHKNKYKYEINFLKNKVKILEDKILRGKK